VFVEGREIPATSFLRKRVEVKQPFAAFEAVEETLSGHRFIIGAKS